MLTHGGVTTMHETYPKNQILWQDLPPLHYLRKTLTFTSSWHNIEPVLSWSVGCRMWFVKHVNCRTWVIHFENTWFVRSQLHPHCPTLWVSPYCTYCSGKVKQSVVVLVRPPLLRQNGQNNLQAKSFLWIHVVRGLVPSWQAGHRSDQLASQQPGSRAGEAGLGWTHWLPFFYSTQAPNPWDEATHTQGEPFPPKLMLLRKMPSQALKGVIFWSPRQLLIQSAWQSQWFYRICVTFKLLCSWELTSGTILGRMAKCVEMGQGSQVLSLWRWLYLVSFVFIVR